MSSSNKVNIKKKLFNQSKSKLTDSFYKTMQEILSQKALYTSNKSLDKASFMLTYLILYFQFTSLLWRPRMNITSWSSYEIYWHTLSLARLDPLVYKLGLETITYYTLSSLIYLIFILLILVFIFSLNKKQLPGFIKWLVGRLLRIEEGVLFIPILAFFCIHIAQTKYGAYFYFEQTSVSFTIYTEINSGICIMIHLFNTVCTQIMGSEIRHSHYRKNFQAKASCSTDIKRIFSRLAIVVIYCSFSFSNIYWLYFLCGTTCIWLGSIYLAYIPYYNQLGNEIVLTKISTELLTVVCFITANYMDSAGFLLLSNIFVVPLLIIFTPILVRWRYSKIPSKPEALANYLLFEVTMRTKLCDIENPSLEVIDSFNIFCKNQKNIPGLIGIWESNYCIYSLNDYRLAYIKLFKSANSSFSFEISFNKYKCRKFLKGKCLLSLEDLNFLNYILKLSNTKEYDKIIVQVYISFATEIVSLDPSILNLEKYVGTLYKQLKQVKKSYEDLCIRYPKGKECQRLWLTFNEEIYMQGEPGLMSKIKYKLDEKSNTDLNYFDEQNGILLVSAERELAGNILYANEQFARILGGNIVTLVNSELNSILPQSFVHGHNEVLIEYAAMCKDSYVEFPEILFLQSERGYLIECFLKITCASLGESLFFLVVARKVETCREIVLVNEAGVVLGHSEHFKNFCVVQDNNLKNYHISILFPNLDYSMLTHDKSVEVAQNDIVFRVQKFTKTIKTSNLTILTFINLQNINSEIIDLEKKNLVLTESRIKPKENLKSDEKSKVKFIARTSETNIALDPTNANENNEKTKSDTNSRYESIINNLVRGLSIAVKNLKIMKWMMLIIMLGLIISNGIYTYFIAKQVAIINEDKILILYGQLISFLESVTVNSMYLMANGTHTLNFKQEILNALVENEDIEHKIMNEESRWTGCKMISRIFQDEYLKTYDSNGVLIEKELGLTDFIHNFKSIVLAFLKKKSENLDCTKEMKYMINNGIFHVSKQLKTDYQDIENCSNHWTADFNFTKDLLVLSQLSVLVLYFCLATYKAYKITHATNLVWKKISESTFNAFYDIRNRCINRLTTYLDTSEEEANLFFDYNRTQKNTFSVKFLQIWPYVWRVLIFILFSTAYFLSIFLVGSMKIENLITDYNALKQHLYHKNFLIIETNFWTISSITGKIDESLVKLYFHQTVNLYSSIDSDILNIKYKKFYFEDYKYLIDRYNEDIKYGLVHTSKLGVLDSYYIFSTKDSQHLDEYSILMNNLKMLNEVIINDVNANGKDVINQEFEFSIMAFVIYGFISISLFLGVYYVFFERKIAHLVKMKELTKMFVSNNKDQLKKKIENPRS